MSRTFSSSGSPARSLLDASQQPVRRSELFVSLQSGDSREAPQCGAAVRGCSGRRTSRRRIQRRDDRGNHRDGVATARRRVVGRRRDRAAAAVAGTALRAATRGRASSSCADCVPRVAVLLERAADDMLDVRRAHRGGRRAAAQVRRSRSRRSSRLRVRRRTAGCRRASRRARRRAPRRRTAHRHAWPMSCSGAM